MKVPFRMKYFSSSKIITHHFHVDNAGGDSRMGYDMIIGRELMAQLGLKANLGRQFMKWDDNLVPMKEPGIFIGKTKLTQRETRKVVMQTSEPASTRNLLK